jgi:hypothetical protein
MFWKRKRGSLKTFDCVADTDAEKKVAKAKANAKYKM